FSHARDRGRRSWVRSLASSEEGPLRPQRHARARRHARWDVRCSEPSGRADEDRRHARDVAPSRSSLSIRMMGAVLPRRLGRGRATGWAGPLAAVLAAATFVHLGSDANAAAWALVQVVLVALAAIDVATRLLPNRITLPVAALAVVLRAVDERS